MSNLTIPAARIRVTVEDATLDLVCFKHLMTSLVDRRQAGTVSGYVEAVLIANPGLAAAGVILPFGLEIVLPEFVVTATGAATKRLWD